MDDQMQKIRQGDLAAFEQVFREQYEALFRFAYRFVQNREEAEEVVQDVFVILWEKRQGLEIKTSLSAYLYAAVRNRALNVVKSAYRRRVSSLESIELEESLTEPVQANPDQSELIALAQRGVESLPEKCRLIFTLSRQAGLTYNEIAEELGVSKETVKSQIKIALKKLREFMERHGRAFELGLALWSLYL